MYKVSDSFEDKIQSYIKYIHFYKANNGDILAHDLSVWIVIDRTSFLPGGKEKSYIIAPTSGILFQRALFSNL